MNNSIHDFIEEIKEDYFAWLYHMSTTEFPRVCDFSSDILASYLIKIYPQESVKFIRGRFDIWSHYWVEVNGEILDFTIVQFIGSKDNLPKFDLSNAEYYQKYFGELLDSPFIPGCYYNRYKKYEEIEMSYVGLVNGNIKFDDYLELVENSLE